MISAATHIHVLSLHENSEETPYFSTFSEDKTFWEFLCILPLQKQLCFLIKQCVAKSAVFNEMKCLIFNILR